MTIDEEPQQERTLSPSSGVDFDKVILPSTGAWAELVEGASVSSASVRGLPPTFWAWRPFARGAPHASPETTLKRRGRRLRRTCCKSTDPAYLFLLLSPVLIVPHG
ncbi:uncharacterized protein B0H18DRAFT_1015204 [Fomitopsis serialis]|uniref:uncharacterized protein n=1 Tax=Fomitopsis serialis TaxID=139415 RepID=UPI002007FBF9|nr:uncharacterized protein B0H18DRAFT_1015204 [Neoantrodia serialis]KAH9923557.1 hypothetical protein B0H18DRAFT_1015204 [Neoantrodia serialis]